MFKKEMKGSKHLQKKYYVNQKIRDEFIILKYDFLKNKQN